MKSIISKAVTFVSGMCFGAVLAMGGPSSAILNSEEPVYVVEESDSFDNYDDDLLLADASMDTDANEGGENGEEDDSLDSSTPNYSNLPAGMVLIDTDDETKENIVVTQKSTSSPAEMQVKKQETKKQQPSTRKVAPKKSKKRQVQKSYRVAQLLHSNTAKDVNPTLAPAVSNDQQTRISEVAKTFENVLEQKVGKNGMYEKTEIIQPGDWLSRRFPNNWEQVAKINDISPDHIIAGEVLFTSTEQGTVSRQNRWNLMGSNPTVEDVQTVTPHLNAPVEIRNMWMKQIAESKSFSANIPWGTELKQVTFGTKSGKTGAQENVYAVWTTPFSGQYNAVPSEPARVWLAETDLGDSYQYHALMKFEKCQNLAWLTFQQAKPVEEEQVITDSRPPVQKREQEEDSCPETECDECPDCIGYEPGQLIINVPPSGIQKRVVRKPLGLKGISKLGMGSSNSLSSGNNVYAGDMAMIGMRFQTRKPLVRWLELNTLIDAGAVYESTSSHNMYVENKNRVLAGVEPSVEMLGFRFGGIIRGGPYEGYWDSVGYTVDWSTELPWNLYAQAGYASFFYNANDRHSEATYSAIYGQFGIRTFGNTVLAGVRTSVAKYDNPEFEARYRPMKEMPLGAFVKVDPFPNLYIQAALWGDHQTGYNKVEKLMAKGNVLQFSADVGYMFFF